MNRFREKFQNFMIGRNGMDHLSRFCVYAALVLIFLSCFVRGASSALSAIALVILVYGYFRIFSRNTARRWEEDQKFMGLWGRFTGLFRNLGRSLKDREHRYYRCPSCRQTVRVPRGKGNISIRCPKCHREFVRRS